METPESKRVLYRMAVNGTEGVEVVEEEMGFV
jgi:hypothetical protein